MPIEDAFYSFGDNLIKKSKANLEKLGKNASKKLSNSLRYDLTISKNSYAFTFEMEDYGDYVDKGVKGVGGTKADGTKWNKRIVTTNNYSYKNKKPPTSVFDKWIVRKGLAGRNSKGQFTSREGLKFAISTSVYHRGLATTKFYSKPFEEEFKKLPQELIEAYALTVENILTND